MYFDCHNFIIKLKMCFHYTNPWVLAKDTASALAQCKRQNLYSDECLYMLSLSETPR